MSEHQKDFQDDPEHPLGFLKRKFDELKARRAKVEEEYRNAIAEIEAKVASLELAYKVLREQYDPEFVADEWIDTGFADLGMTDRIRAFLYSSPAKSFTPTLLRDLLVADRFNLKGRSNPMAEIHAVLKRLAKYGEIEEVQTPEGRKAYKWSDKKRHAVKQPVAS